MSRIHRLPNNWWKWGRSRRGGGGATPTTVLQIEGADYNGTVLTPTIGGSTTKTGVFTTGTNPIIGGTEIRSNATGSLFTFDNQINSGTDNYVVIFLGYYTTGSSTGLLLDFRKQDASSYNLILEDRNAGGDDYNGYGYGVSGNLGSWSAVTGEDTRVHKIRVWIFQGGKGNLFLNGGSTVYTDDWQPTHLGGAGYDAKFMRLIASSQFHAVSHLSIHAFPQDETVSLSWLNAYCTAIKDAYTGLSWTNIESV